MVENARGMVESQPRDENLKYVMNLCNKVIEIDYVPYGLKEKIEERISELVSIWEKKREQAITKNTEIGGLQLIFSDILRAVGKAESLERKYGKKTKCQYLREGLETLIPKRGALGNWFLAHTIIH
jgi:hypothetical protein